MKETTCCFAGHRIISAEKSKELAVKLNNVISELYAQGIRTFISGAARGFDLLAAQAVIERRKEHSDIKLVLAIPCSDQTRGWNNNDLEIYEK